jgi:hypothetical protein
MPETVANDGGEKRLGRWHMTVTPVMRLTRRYGPYNVTCSGGADSRRTIDRVTRTTPGPWCVAAARSNTKP